MARSNRRPASRALPPSALVLLLAAWSVVRYAQIALLGWGSGSDVALYQKYASQWAGGQAPYVDFHPEYPPGAMLVFLVPSWVNSGADYWRAFRSIMALLDLWSLLGVVVCVRMMRGAGSLVDVAASGLAYLAMTAALYPVLYTRFDLVPGALTLLAVYLAIRSRERASAFVLGLGAATKLWPVALAPLILGRSFRRGGFRFAAPSLAWFLFGCALPATPFLAQAGGGVLRFLAYHSERGIQIESTWASIALCMEAAGLANVEVIHTFGATHVVGPVPAMLARVSSPASLLLALTPSVLAFAESYFRPSDRSGEVIVAAASATILGLMIGSNVLSPQFVLWVAPFLALWVRGPAPVIVAVSASILTTVVYPHLSPALENTRDPMHVAAVACAASRNLILVLLYALCTTTAAKALFDRARARR